MQAEQSYKNVNLSVNEADIRSLANANGKNMDAMLELLAENGVSQVLFKESTIASLENAGDIVVALGPAVQTLSVADSLPGRSADQRDELLCRRHQRRLARSGADGAAGKDPRRCRL